MYRLTYFAGRSYGDADHTRPAVRELP
jgi:hypothetical protein